MNIQEIQKSELTSINGGFVCGGLCVGLIFAAAFTVGAGVTIGVAVATKEDPAPSTTTNEN